MYVVTHHCVWCFLCLRITGMGMRDRKSQGGLLGSRVKEAGVRTELAEAGIRKDNTRVQGTYPELLHRINFT